MGFGQGNKVRVDLPDHAQRKETFGTHAQTCHVWAQQNAATYYGRAKDGRISFEGPTIFSYGHHFPMAHFARPDVVLVTTERYSVSTSAHCREVRGALHGLPATQIYIPGLKAVLRGDREAKRAAMIKLIKGLAAGDARNKCELFAKLFKPGIAIPAAPAVWIAKRDAIAKRKASLERTREARKLIKQCADLAIVIRPRGESAYELEQAIRIARRHLSEVYSARKALQATPYVKRASAIIARWKPAIVEAEKKLAAMRAVEQRESELSELKEIRAWLQGTSKCIQSYKTQGELGAYMWGRAIREGFDDVAALCAREVHRWRWEQETYIAPPPDPADKDKLAQWLAGQNVRLPYSVQYGDGGLTRVRRYRDNLETSRGAVVPWLDALRVFTLAQACRNTGRAWERNGTQCPVGHFQIDKVTQEGNLRAGCHLIAWSEMERLAMQEIPDRLRPRFPLPSLEVA